MTAIRLRPYSVAAAEWWMNMLRASNDTPRLELFADFLTAKIDDICTQPGSFRPSCGMELSTSERLLSPELGDCLKAAGLSSRAFSWPIVRMVVVPDREVYVVHWRSQERENVWPL